MDEINKYERELIAEWRDKKQRIIGFYTKKNDGHFYIEDIRSLGFSELRYKDDGEIVINVEEITNLPLNKYYEFSWTTEIDESVRGFHIVPKDNKFKELTAKQLVERLYNIWGDKDYDTIRQMSKIQDMVKTQLTASSDGTFIYELLQNANDYPVERDSQVQLVDVEFHITSHYLIYRHTGRVFSPRNIAAISKMSDGEKRKKKNAIGYKGIGFKTVFSENQYVYLLSGEYSLRFDEGITSEEFNSSKCPWQLMPIWTDQADVDKEVLDIINGCKDFRVQMAIRPNDTDKLRIGNRSFEFILNDIFKDEKDILFIPNIKSVKVFYDGVEQISRTKDPAKWVLTEEPLVYNFTSEEVNNLIREVSTDKRIPEKYKDFEDTRVSFACQREGRIIKPVENARIYCYLPTQVSLGFPFLMNTDMIPTGPRDNIEKGVKLNLKIMTIAGIKFAEWISSLLHSGNYDLCSVFTIIPKFYKVENYEDFITVFHEGFNSRLSDLEFIPCENGTFSVISNTLIDETGLLSSGIMPDAKFLEFSELGGSLPAVELRSNDIFKDFVKKYIQNSNIFDCDKLRDLIRKDIFQEWLKDQDNNNNFLKFLLDNGLLNDFLNEMIFIGQDRDELYRASQLYYDIDEELEDLSAFKSHLGYLSLETRAFFKDNEKWDEVIRERFGSFDGKAFINSTLLNDNWDETCNALKEWDTSFHFYNFLAKKKIVPDRLSDLPFFDDDSNIVTDFKDKFVFLSSSEGKTICSAQWLSSVTFAFVSPKYKQAVLNYFKENAGVKEYSDGIIINDIILSNDHQSAINESQQQSYKDSEDFVRFCYEYSDSFDEGALEDYALNALNRDEEESFETYDAPLFFHSEHFDDYSKKEWIDSDWMYYLNPDYLSIDSEESEESVKAFLEKAFKIKELTADTFYTKIVRPKLKPIFENTSGSIESDGSKNLDFIKYLDDNYHLIFEEERDADKFKEFLFISDDRHVISPAKKTVYAFNSELDKIINSEWFPKDLIQLCSRNYEDSKAILAIGAKEYKFGAFFDEIIAQNLGAINSETTSKEASILFHTFIFEHFTDLSDNQKEKMKGAKVYLRGKSTPATTATGHKLLSPNASKLFELGLVEADSLDLIATEDYNLSLNYWKSLGNEEFTLSHFSSWITKNLESFATTLQQVELNKAFWKWLKDNSTDAKSLLEVAKELPILLADGSYVQSDTVFFSDEYLGESKIESLVKQFNNAAHFLSPSYIDEDGQDVAQWKEFFSKVGVKYEIVDILIDTIDNRLPDIEDANLPAIITEYQSKLEKHYGENFISKLKDLRVKAKDGKFYSLDKIVYIACEKDEPFTFIEIPNQVSFESYEERTLITRILDKINGTQIKKLTEWQSIKIDRYLKIQSNEDQNELLLSIYYRFIDELALIYAEDKDSLNEFDDITNVLFLDSKGKFVSAATLTLGSIYKPFCDFERFGLDYQYLSGTYKRECKNDIRKMLNKVFGIHCDFKERDIPNLEKRDFAIYFWSEYLLRLDADIRGVTKLIEDGKFDEVACIPTKDYIKKPCELYYGSKVSDYLKKIEDWENKTPLVSIPEIEMKDKSTLFSKFKFKNALNFLDALYALSDVKKKKDRKQLIDWMIEDYDSKYDTIIQQYKASAAALWFNSKGEESQIAELYALEYDNRKLEQYFGSNPKIIDKSYFPIGDSGKLFTEACKILQIQTLTDADFEFKPIGDKLCLEYGTDLDLFALIIAGITDIENWEELYSEYDQKLESLQLYRCSEIHYECIRDQSINRNFTKFYHNNDDSNFYFVGDIHRGSVFRDFVEELKKFLKIDQIANDIIDHLLESRDNAERYIKEEAQLLSNESFRAKLISIVPEITDQLQAPPKVVDDEDVTPITRQTVTTSTATQRDEIADSKDNDADNIPATQNLEDVNEDDNRSANDLSTINRGHIEHEQSEDQPSDIPAQSSSTTDEGDSGRRSYSKQNLSHDTASQIDGILQTEDVGNSVGGELPADYDYDSGDEYIGSVDNDPDHDGLGSIPTKPRSFGTTRRPPKPYTAAEVHRPQSNTSPLELESLPPTSEEIDTLGKMGITPEQIADTNYLAQLRLYQYLCSQGDTPEEDRDAFVLNAANVTEHKLEGGKYIHACSAARGVMYISPSVWNKMLDDRCEICVFLNGRGSKFRFIESKEEFLQLVEKDDVVIKITGKEKVDVVNQLYSGILKGVKGTAYTLIRVASPTDMDAVFAHYVGSMAESNDGNEDPNEY